MELSLTPSLREAGKPRSRRLPGSRALDTGGWEPLLHGGGQSPQKAVRVEGWHLGHVVWRRPPASRRLPLSSTRSSGP